MYSSLTTGLASGLGSTSNNTALTIKSSPPKTAAVARRLGVRVGTLTKRNESNQWQRRYCALVPQTLLYYFDSESSESARGIIDLEYYTDVEIVAKNTIRLSTPPDIPLRSFFFRADNDEQCAAWAAALSRERYFVVAEERDAYQKLQMEFQKESSATAEKVEKLREAMGARRCAIEAAEARQHDALHMLRSQALSLGLSSEAAASLVDAKDAVREVAHRLHYHMRRASRLEGAIEAVREERSALKSSSSSSLLPLQATAPHDGDELLLTQNDSSTTTGTEQDVATRVREVDELREKLSAVRRAREREATARAALESEHAALRSKLEELQRSVQLAAEARLRIENKASELNDQKKLLVREVKTTRRAVAKVQAELEAPDEESHRVMALRRVGLDKSAKQQPSANGTDSSDPGSDTDNSDNNLMTRHDRLEDVLNSQHSNASSSNAGGGLGTTTDLLLSSFAAASRSARSSSPPPAAANTKSKLHRNSHSGIPQPSDSSPFALLCKRCGGTVEGPQFSTCRCSEPAL